MWTTNNAVTLQVVENQNNILIKTFNYYFFLMNKKIYEQPRMFVYEVETSAILAVSTGFKVEGNVTSGDDEDVWEE